VPELRGVISFFAVIEVITVLVWTFAWVYVLTRGGPAGSTMVVDLYIFQQAIQFRSYGIAAAAAVVLLVVTIGLIAIRFMLPQRQD
jgi:ABC-type sugar transport system permease subunit